MDLEPTILAVPLSNTEYLVSVNDSDTMTNEQMWPTDEEMVEQMLTSYLLRPVSVSFSQEWSMLASDGQSNSQIDVLCKSQTLFSSSRQSPSPQ